MNYLNLNDEYIYSLEDLRSLLTNELSASSAESLFLYHQTGQLTEWLTKQEAEEINFKLVKLGKGITIQKFIQSLKDIILSTNNQDIISNDNYNIEDCYQLIKIEYSRDIKSNGAIEYWMDYFDEVELNVKITILIIHPCNKHINVELLCVPVINLGNDVYSEKEIINLDYLTNYTISKNIKIKMKPTESQFIFKVLLNGNVIREIPIHFLWYRDMDYNDDDYDRSRLYM